MGKNICKHAMKDKGKRPFSKYTLPQVKKQKKLIIF